jgi:uroporphyrinogen decarboxylase
MVQGVETRGRLPAVIESIRRVKILLGHVVAIVAVVTSPLSIAARILGADPLERLRHVPAEAKRLLDVVGRVATVVARAYCQLEPDIVAIVDEYVLRLSPEQRNDVLPLYRTVGNLVRFFNARSVLVTRAGVGDKLGVLAELNVDGVAIGGQPEPAELKQLKDKGLALGLGVPLSVSTDPSGGVERFVASYASALGRRRFFLTTEWEVPYDMLPDSMHALTRGVASVHW